MNDFGEYSLLLLLFPVHVRTYVAGCVSSVRLVYDGFHLKPLT